jgi:hypothetical protein
MIQCAPPLYSPLLDCARGRNRCRRRTANRGHGHHNSCESGVHRCTEHGARRWSSQVLQIPWELLKRRFSSYSNALSLPRPQDRMHAARTPSLSEPHVQLDVNSARLSGARGCHPPCTRVSSLPEGNISEGSVEKCVWLKCHTAGQRARI